MYAIEEEVTAYDAANSEMDADNIWNDAFGDQYVEENMHAKGTSILYNGYVKRFKEWIVTLSSTCTFKDGLDKLGPHSEQLCRTWLAQKVKEAKVGARTLAGMHAALKWYFVTNHSYDTHPLSGWRKVGGVWTGNPVFGTKYNLLKSKKRQERRSQHTSKSSPSMLCPHLSLYLQAIKKE